MEKFIQEQIIKPKRENKVSELLGK